MVTSLDTQCTAKPIKHRQKKKKKGLANRRLTLRGKTRDYCVF